VIAGLVLAGGKSSRFGAEKALAKLHGLPLVEHALRKLDAICSDTAINAPPFSETAKYVRYGDKVRLLVSDAPYDPPGPLAGVRAGLEWAIAQNATDLATAPCDAPLMPEDVFTRLREAQGHAMAVCARTPGGLHPLAAIWRREALPLLTAALAQGKHPPVRQLFADWGGVVVDFPDDAPFANINTPEDLAAAEASQR
jgi:molybdopterin-guanine dinucleotide biosynthesis protein A